MNEVSTYHQLHGRNGIVHASAVQMHSSEQQRQRPRELCSGRCSTRRQRARLDERDFAREGRPDRVDLPRVERRGRQQRLRREGVRLRDAHILEQACGSRGRRSCFPSAAGGAGGRPLLAEERQVVDRVLRDVRWQPGYSARGRSVVEERALRQQRAARERRRWLLSVKEITSEDRSHSSSALSAHKNRRQAVPTAQSGVAPEKNLRQRNIQVTSSRTWKGSVAGLSDCSALRTGSYEK